MFLNELFAENIWQERKKGVTLHPQSGNDLRATKENIETITID